MANAGTIAVNLIARTEAFAKGMNRSQRIIRGFEKSTVNTMRQLRNFGIAAIAGTGAAVYGMKKLVDVASDAEEIMNKFNVVFKELSGQSKEWAIDFADSVGRARQDVIKWMAGLQDTFVPLGYARDRAAELSKQLVTLAVDVGSFNNIADAEVIRDFTSAIVGNHEAVRKYGIIITETSMKQDALNEGLDPKNLTNLQKVQLRYNAILNATKDAQGDAIRTSDSYANQVKRLEANILNLKEAIGKELLPIFNLFVTKANDAISVFERQDGLDKSIRKAAIASTYLVDAFNFIRSVVNAVVGGMQKLFSLFQIIPAEIAKGFGKLAELVGAEELASVARQISEDIDSVGNAMYEAGKKNIEQSIEQMKNIGKLRKEMLDTFRKADEVVKRAETTAVDTAQEIENTKKEVSKSGSAEVFSSRFIDVRGLQNREGEMYQKQMAGDINEMLSIQRQAFR